MSTLDSIGGDLASALEAVSVPSYVIDPSGVIRWLNPAAQQLVGDVRGRQFSSVVAPEDSRRAKEHFARKVAGTERVSDTDVVVIGADGERVKVEVSSVCLTDGHQLVGVFGQVVDVDEADDHHHMPDLTPRQAEVLRHLQQGRSTEQISQELHLSPETVRNHVRRLLKALGVHTRLEAVAIARPGRPAPPDEPAEP
jgi:PAS domain S-box-containing protein